MQHKCVHHTVSICGIPQVYRNYYNIKLYGTVEAGCKLVHSFIHSFIRSLAHAECDNTLPFSGTSSILLCCVLFPSTQFPQLIFHPLLLHLAIYFLVYLSVLFPNSYLKLFWKFCFLPFSVHVQTNAIYLAL